MQFLLEQKLSDLENLQLSYPYISECNRISMILKLECFRPCFLMKYSGIPIYSVGPLRLTLF